MVLFSQLLFWGPKSGGRQVIPMMDGRFPFRQNFQFDRFKCKLNTRFHRNVFRTNGRTSGGARYSNFSVLTGWNKNSREICAIQFRPVAGTCNFFPPFPISKRCSREVAFFFPLLILSFKMKPARPMWERCLLLLQEIRRNCPKVPQCYRHPFCWTFTSREEWYCKRGSQGGKPFHLIRNISGISNRKFCRNGKRPSSYK